MTAQILPTMTLSQAMREGARLLPNKAKQTYFGFSADLVDDDHWRDHPMSCCALGAVWYVNKVQFDLKAPRHGVYFQFGITDTLYQFYPELEIELPEELLPQELANDDPYMVHTAIIELNDLHEWTREAIAEWLANIGL